ncbi:MAG: EamA family transporter RarD [Alphaproteobacteria bacterium]|nr:EamA family transporter RarD [Alphaproteobacteria bacterium]
MTEAGKGVIALVAACTIWGLSPIYYKALAHVPPLEVLSHRTLWSFVLFGIVLLVQGRFPALFRAIGDRKNLLIIALAALMISTNWFVFILSIQIGKAVEASLGYFIFPLVAVALGYVAFGERLGRTQWFAVALAVFAVVVLAYGLGAPPWIALILSVSFGIYGLAKKALKVGPVVSVTAEVFLLLPFALIWIWGGSTQGWAGVTDRAGGFFGANMQDTVLLMLSGAMTAGPLILFSYATKRLTLASVGLLLYINPTLQFAVAVLVFQEAFTFWHAVTFALIWTALVIYTFSAWRVEKSSRRAVIKSATLVTTETESTKL